MKFIFPSLILDLEFSVHVDLSFYGLATLTNIKFDLFSADALIGVKDLFQKHPEELRLHKYAVIQKLRERITDDDKTVREMLHQLFKTVIFPAYKEVFLFFLCDLFA